MEEPQVRSYSVYKKHLDYLDHINNESHSAAVRLCIDRCIKNDERHTKGKIIRNFNQGLLFIAFSFIFFSLVYLPIPTIMQGILLVLGFTMIALGIIGLVTYREIQ